MVGFNRDFFNLALEFCVIYIPLWSDSILRADSGTRSAISFTFHYGRIQSPLMEAFSVAGRNLHSIMVGFNLDPAGKIQRVHTDLHSIMVGFNQGRDRSGE